MHTANETSSANTLGRDDNTVAPARKVLFAAWKRLDRIYRPTRPRMLAMLLLQNHSYPLPDFHPSPNARYNLENEIDVNFQRFVYAARALRRSLPRSNDEYLLWDLLKARVPAGPDGESADRGLFQLEDWLLDAQLKFGLVKRPVRKRPPSVQNLYVRDLVRDVFWYILHFERQRPTVSFVNGHPTSRATVLAAAIVSALGYSLKGFKRHVDEVMRDQTWQSSSFYAWKTLPRAHPKMQD